MAELASEDMALKCVNGPLKVGPFPFVSTGLGESPSPAIKLVKPRSNQPLSLSKLGLAIFHDADLSITGAAVNLSTKSFSCAPNVAFRYGEERPRELEIASQYLFIREKHLYKHDNTN